jgi:NADH-quinone oxidoreductase subunit L
MALLMVAFPLIASALGLLLGGRSRRLARVVAIVGASAALVVSLHLVLLQPWNDPITTQGLTGGFQPLPFATLVDGLAVTTSVMVCVVALLVQIFSIRYMENELRYPSYSAFISLFTAAMLAVVVAGDLLMLVVGWEVMGLCSYLLIGQHWEQRDAQRAAVKAFLVTKLGDVGFILGIIVLITTTGTLLVTDAVSSAANDSTASGVVSLLLFVGVMGKSAQFPLHAWLPDAMAGPSPVSALIHAATMVAAGVYVVARMYPLFLASTSVLTLMAVISCVTMLGAALAALAQDDLKRVLAWSTVSQLAFMVAALACGSVESAEFHLLTHACFKALLFLSAGAIIHAVGSNAMQDMGGLRRSMPVTFVTMTIALLALVGVVPLSGFFSKESILAAAETAARGDGAVSPAVGWLVLVVSVITIAVTAAYASRLWLMTFGGPARSTDVHEAPASMRWPLIVLAVPTVLLGFLGLRSGWLPTWMQPNGTMSLTPVALTPEVLTFVLSAAAILVGGGWAWAASRGERSRDVSLRLGRLRSAFASGFGFDAVYDWVAVRPYRLLVRLTVAFDKKVVSDTVRNTGRATESIGRWGQQLQRGDVQQYLSTVLTIVVVGVVVMLVAVAT